MSVRLIIFMGISLLIGLGAGCGTSESRLALNSDLTGGAKTIVAPRIGAQLWSVRDALKEDFDGTLTALSLQGFEGVEFAGYFGKYAERPADLKRFLASIGLTTSPVRTTRSAVPTDRYVLSSSRGSYFDYPVGCPCIR